MWNKNWNNYLSEKEFEIIKTKIDPSELYPEQEDIFKCFNYFRPDRTKVVFVLLSPYQRGIATGLAMGIEDKKDDTATLSSVRDCLAVDLNHPMIEEEFDYSLESWARQGVLLYNCALTVPRIGHSTGHVKLWMNFTEHFLKKMNSELAGMIYVFMGRNAQVHMPLITGKTNHVFKTCHPVATAYAKQRNKDIPLNLDFEKSQIFNKVNQALIEENKSPINWI